MLQNTDLMTHLGPALTWLGMLCTVIILGLMLVVFLYFAGFALGLALVFFKSGFLSASALF